MRGGARPTLSSRVREVAEPLAAGTYVVDWVARAQALVAMSDIAVSSAREDAYWSPDGASLEEPPLSLRPTRATAGVALQARPDRLSLNVDFTELADPMRQLVADATVGLDAAEKVVISAAAWSLCELANPPELVLDLLNLLYEEALHLDAIGRLLGLDHSRVEWIPRDRRTNWDLVRASETPLDYMVIEHCLYEGRGTVASAAGAFQLEESGAPTAVVDVFAAIARQEANHNIAGFRWLKLLDTADPDDRSRLAELIRKFLDVEPLPEPDRTARSLRKHFPLYLIELYRQASDFYRVKEAIVSASRSARRTGLPGIPADRLYSAARATAEWSRSSEVRE
jgi:hypothetical protein